MTTPREWDLPPALTHISLDRDELAVLDWHLCGHYLCNVSRGSDIGEVIQTWDEFRRRVWEGILALSVQKDPGIPLSSTSNVPTYRLPMDESAAKYLFNWLPPTFMWGTGRDCGFTLKVRLYRFLTGQEEAINDYQDAAEGGTKDTPIPDA